MKQGVHPFWIANGIVICFLFATPTQAEIVQDTTLPNNSSVTTQNNISTIGGGTVAGSNLFHSFEQFSVSPGNTAYFDNPIDIQNIIARVTGSSISRIDGAIQANGTANLFLLNSQGIIFGPSASLNIGGSFLASTASSLQFADGTQFSTTASQTPPLLTISAPLGLQFAGTTGRIVNQSTVRGTGTRGLEDIVGLRVQPGKTLALVGGDVALEGGYLTAQAGRIEVGSVADPGQVSLTSTPKGWILGYEGVENFKDIQLSQKAFVDASGEGGGDIHLQGRRVIVTEGSQIASATFGAEPGGTLMITASDLVEVSKLSPDGKKPSGLVTLTLGSGKAGDILINTGKLLVQNNAFISAESTETAGATGRGGDLTVNATESVEIISSFLLTQTRSMTDAGDLMINTGQLSVRDGAVVSASTFGSGKGGDIRVNASHSVDVSGVGSIGLSTVLGTSTFGMGQGGNITVDTKDFRVADGALLNALTSAKGDGGNITVNTQTFAALNGGQLVTTTRATTPNGGDAGDITVNSTNSVVLFGTDPTFAERSARFPGRVLNEGAASGLFANTGQGSTGNGGDVKLNTTQLKVRDEAVVNVSSQGTGDAGDLEVKARFIHLDNQGKLTATSVLGQGGGNIRLQDLNLLLLRNNSEISTNAGGEGNGGDITIDTDLLVALENSDITANAVEGRGGNIHITTQGLFLSPDSQITAASERGIDGIVEIIRPEVDPSEGIVTLPEEVVDVTRLVAQGCPGGRGNVATASKLMVTGGGGLPPSPKEALNSDAVKVNLVTLDSDSENRSPSAVSISTPRATAAPMEAQGWVVGTNGKVVLTAYAPTTSSRFWQSSAECGAPQSNSRS